MTLFIIWKWNLVWWIVVVLYPHLLPLTAFQMGAAETWAATGCKILVWSGIGHSIQLVVEVSSLFGILVN